LVQLQEAENQIITHYEVYDHRPADQRLLISAVETHKRKLGRVPRLVAAEAGYHSRANEEAVKEMGVKYVSIPNRSTRGAAQATKTALVQARSSVAHRMRRPDQHSEAASRIGAMPVPRNGWDATVDRLGRDRRQPHQYRKGLAPKVA
jgi:hypothetical protein